MCLPDHPAVRMIDVLIPEAHQGHNLGLVARTQPVARMFLGAEHMLVAPVHIQLMGQVPKRFGIIVAANGNIILIILFF